MMNSKETIINEYATNAQDYCVKLIDQYNRNVAQWEGEIAERQAKIDATKLLLAKTTIVLEELPAKFPALTAITKPMEVLNESNL